MNAKLLLAHFDRISDAPDAVPRLRRLVLDLAVRGKLVEQDLNDEKPGTLVRVQGGNSADNNSDLPVGWASGEVGQFLNFQYGKGLPAAARQEAGPVPVFGSNGVVAFCAHPLSEAPAIIVGRKGSAGALNLCNGPSWTTDVAYFVEAPSFFSIKYLYLALQTLDLDKLGKGVKPGLSRNDAYLLRLCVPPLAEQRRIVAKVDELMALCDRLEVAQQEHESRLDRLAASTHHHLNNGADAESIRGHAQFFIGHLPRLTTDPEQIDALRRTILTLAVQGRLVQQNPADGSSASLLATIRKIRATDAHRTKSSTVNDSDPKFVQHLPQRLPNGWLVCPLEELFRFVDYRGRTPTRTAKGVRLITAKNVRMGYVSNDPIEYIEERAYTAWMTRGFPENGDLLFVTEGATMGFVGSIEFQFVFALAQRTIDLQPHLRSCSRFFLFTLMSPILQEAILTNSTGTAVKGIKAAKLKRIRVPLPPLAEQHRIVAKVDELMALCDQLEARLTTAQTEASHLLASVLYNALQASG